MAVVIVRRRDVSLTSLNVSFNGGGAAGRDGAEYKRIGAERIRLRRLMDRIGSTDRLTPQQEQDAIALFKRTKGISKYPTAFAAPSQAAKG